MFFLQLAVSVPDLVKRPPVDIFHEDTWVICLWLDKSIDNFRDRDRGLGTDKAHCCCLGEADSVARFGHGFGIDKTDMGSWVRHEGRSSQQLLLSDGGSNRAQMVWGVCLLHLDGAPRLRKTNFSN